MSRFLPRSHSETPCQPCAKPIAQCSLQNISRREFFQRLLLAAGSATIATASPSPSQAINGLRIFPLQEPLTNNYFLMRACQSQSDAANITAVNPIDRLSIEKLGLTRRGARDAIKAAKALETAGVCEDAWIWPSITISSFETAEIVASQMRVRRDRIVPEFSFLDARGVGALDGKPIPQVQQVLYEHDRKNPTWRPEPGVDGTPNDSAEDVFVRVRQLISKLETQYFGEDILVISPDSDTLSVWQATVMGRMLSDHPGLAFRPGEIRRVKEEVQDSYGKVVVQPTVETIFIPA